jgi:hypothetical protein
MLNEKKFQAIYDDFLSSGLTAREYCSNLGMSEAKFYYWKKRLKDQGHSANGFIPLVFEQKQTAGQQLPVRTIPEKLGPPPAFYEIIYPNGTSIKLSGQPPMEVLQGLLRINLSGNV